MGGCNATFETQYKHRAGKLIVINPTKLLGPWQEGYVLDVHTTSSTLIGYDEFGHERFETVRTPLGEALYKLKYKSDLTVLEPLANTVADFLVTKGIHQKISLLTIVPPTNTRRRFQPNIELAKLVGMTLHVPVYLDYILKAKDISQLKDVFDPEKRRGILTNAYKAKDASMNGK